jgi:hypothetical protein
MAFLVGCEVHVADLVEKLHAGRPLVHGQFDLPRKVVHMLQKRSEDDTGSVIGLRANGSNNRGCEGGIKAVCHCESLEGKLRRGL